MYVYRGACNALKKKTGRKCSNILVSERWDYGWFIFFYIFYISQMFCLFTGGKKNRPLNVTIKKKNPYQNGTVIGFSISM